MTPREVLASHTSRELSEWRAYERLYGLTPTGYRDEGIASLVDEIRALRYEYRSAHTPPEKQSQLEKPQDYPRPDAPR